MPIWEKLLFFCILFGLTLVKNFKMERGIMKRFVEDYDPEIHEKFPFCTRGNSDQVVLDDVISESDR